MSNKINNFLQGVSADLQPLCIDQNILENKCAESDMNFTIEPYAVERELSSIDVHKANGPDNVPNWFFHDFSVWLAEPYMRYFQRIYSQRFGALHLETSQCHSSP